MGDNDNLTPAPAPDGRIWRLQLFSYGASHVSATLELYSDDTYENKHGDQVRQIKSTGWMERLLKGAHVTRLVYPIDSERVTDATSIREASLEIIARQQKRTQFREAQRRINS